MKVTLIAGIVLLTAATFAAAEVSTDATTTTSTSTMANGSDAFDALDTNHDGVVTTAEAQDGGMTDFNAADRNGDRVLDQSEFAQRITTTSTLSTSSKSRTISEPASDDTTPMPSVPANPGMTQAKP